MSTRLLLAVTLAALIGGGNGICMLGCDEGSGAEVAAAPADPAPCHAAVPPTPAEGEDEGEGCLHCATSLVAFSAASAALAHLAPPTALHLPASQDSAEPRGAVLRLALRMNAPPPQDLRLLESSLLL